jgi:hypothetical protein
LYDVNGANPNNPLINQSFSTFVNINDELGNLLYREEHYASTDANGLITVKMGDGLYTAGPITNFNQINWGVGKYYLVVDFVINGTTSSTAPEQLVTVPYSFYAGNAGNGMTSVIDNGDGTLTFTYANGATYTTPTLAGIQGAVGPAGPVGPPGPQGQQGVIGTDGLNALINTITEPAGANCTNGGTKIETGLDANENGILDAGEVNISETQYVCNGVASSGNQTISINGVATNQYVPDYLYNTGNCSNGSLSTTGNYTINSTYAEYCNLTINAGHTFSLGGTSTSETFTILVKDTLRISGTINGVNSAINYPSGNGNVNTVGGTGGGAKAMDGANLRNGKNALISWNSYNSVYPSIDPLMYSNQILGGISTATSNLCGGNGQNSSTAILKEAIKIRSQLFGTEGGSGSTNCCSTYPGGLGGDGIYIICRVLVFNGSILLRGANGPSEGAGGGGGGSCIISADEIINSSGIINLSGGLGTGPQSAFLSTCDFGGTGGNGAYLIIDR